MTGFRNDLYVLLEDLVANTEAFYSQDFTLDGEIYRVYNYRLASYTDFMQPGALEARGVMFRVSGSVPDLVCLPMSKFFNLNENPFVMGLDLSAVDTIQLKADGSLISTYLHQGDLRLKTKGSLFSEQAIAAQRWLSNHGNGDIHRLWTFLRDATRVGITVNLEWTAPDNRVVIGYLEPRLTILNCRRMDDGRYLSVDEVIDLVNGHTDTIKNFTIDHVTPDDPEAFIHSIPDMLDDIEGYVVKLVDGTWFKCKTNKYLSLHHAKDSVTNPRRLFEAVVDEGVDDLLAMFATDQLAVQTIRDMQVKVDEMYNHMVSVVEKFYEANKELTRKDYAIKSQNETPKLYFGLTMLKYTGDEVDYKKFLKSKWKDLGLRDSSSVQE